MLPPRLTQPTLHERPETRGRPHLAETPSAQYRPVARCSLPRARTRRHPRPGTGAERPRPAVDPCTQFATWNRVPQ
ncbi:hypothetical protein NDU88_001995 [Pleurodeles waltl]|uniref:Uncharacterized protein n=1 Tax=Pleurodeles waltl TaxID=8319 RepID=A0AAV7P5U9_PLEWA|nr:hypothetical protein NDU88_001995 [Pleurodeles waltl]